MAVRKSTVREKIREAEMIMNESASKITEKDFTDPAYYENRELSWLKFDERCLEEARDGKVVPLFERLKFLSITQSNLDEFIIIRVASIKDQLHADYKGRDISGMTPKMLLTALSERMHEFVDKQYNTFQRSLVPLLRKAGLKVITDYHDLTEEQGNFLDTYFEEEIYPVLTPMAMDPSRPFPLIRNRTLNIGALVTDKKGGSLTKKEKKKKGAIEFATVQVPSILPRVIEIPSGDPQLRCVIMIEEIIKKYLPRLFQRHEVVCMAAYRVMRDADLTYDEEDADDLLREIQSKLKKRQRGKVIRLEVEEDIDPALLKILKKEFDIDSADLYSISGPLDLTFCMQIYGLDGFDEYREKKYTPAPCPDIPEGSNIFEAIRAKDILLHHPYVTFDPVIDFVKEAAADPDVLAIKQTLYRVSGNSPIIAALAQAADNGKQVTVLVELKARFDEEHNIEWAMLLEKAGVHVIYGLLGLKVHSKITMVVRREEDGIRRYVHLATGNYNDSTAKLYTDFGLFTCDEAIGRDATAVFNMLSGYSEPDRWHKLLVAPVWLKNDFLSMIKRETVNALAGKESFIRAKMNSVCDPAIIAALYEASAAGVKIDLIVRGICSIKVGILGVSDNITVRSIVGNFLEHSRVFWFCNDGDEEIYMGSSDWMPRNLDKRVEIVFPVESEEAREEIKHVMTLEYEDTVKAHILTADGHYVKVDKRGKAIVNSQEILCAEATARGRGKKTASRRGRFIPMTSSDEKK